jgi:hypothetical protein
MDSFDKTARTGERGNILLMILLAIVLLGLLTAVLTQNSTEQSSVLSRQTQDDQINRMITYAGTLSAALQQMTINGEDPFALYSTLSLLKPGDAGFETAPNNLKIFHPLGGGITYQSASSPDPNAVAAGYNINASSVITGVGDTTNNPGKGDVIFTANIASASYCARINQILTNSSTVPVMDSATFTSLFGGATVTVTAGNCASCVNAARLCVSNTGATAWGFYSALFPPPYCATYTAVPSVPCQ